jgi:hypothetical protein
MRVRLPALLAAAALATSAHAAGTCGGSLAGHAHAIESSRYVVAYVTAPDPVSVGQHFTVDFAVCPRGDVAAPQSVRIDATMPEHRHGMNYRPGVTVTSPGVYRAEGMLFHMPGRWDVTFDVVTASRTERLTSTLRVE